MSSSAANMLDNQDDHNVLELKSNYSMSFSSNTQYTLGFDAVCDNRGGLANETKLVFHMSGSAFTLAENTTNQNAGFGKAIAALTFPDAANSVKGTEQTRHEAVFEPDFNGTAVLQIKSTHGHLSLIHI